MLLQHLRDVYVPDAGLKVKSAKCHLLQSNVCHVVSDRGIERRSVLQIGLYL